MVTHIVTIRAGRKDDIETLAAIERSAAELFRGTAMEFAIDDTPLERTIIREALEQDNLWIAEHDGERAGFLCGRKLDGLLYIEELAVADIYQGLGLGRALMETCIGEAHGRFDGIALTTDRTLPWNAPFYEKLGFRELTDRPPAIARKLQEEVAAGFDPDRRCAMILRFD